MPAVAAPHFQTDFPPVEFERRREQIFESIGKNVAVLSGGKTTGAFDRFRQTNDFFYLCGVEVPQAYLLLDGSMRWTSLYLPRRDPGLERKEGPQLNASDPDFVQRVTGIDEVKPLERLVEDLRDVTDIFLPQAPAEGRQACRDTLHHARALRDADPWDGQPFPEAWFQARVQAAAPGATLHDLSPVLDRMRLIKSTREIELMRRAGRLTAAAVVEAMRFTQPGQFEFELAAVADYLYLRSGARGGGYRPIVASGPQIWNAHYYRNDAILQSGDLVLMDYAPDVGGYTSDIGRMWPVNGKYSPVQRELYGFIIEYHKTLLRTIQPGRTTAEIVEEAAAAMRPCWTDWNWSSPRYARAAQSMMESEVAFTHPVGMAVHDVGEYRHDPLRAGLVFALDPQLWVPEEELYLRVEDTVVVTAVGAESLTREAPLDLDAVESLLASSRHPAGS